MGILFKASYSFLLALIIVGFPFSILSSQEVTQEEWELVVGSDNFPQVKMGKSNCNLDLVQFDGKYFLAWRNAPFHFASSKTKLLVVSSTDAVHWDLETIVEIGADMREPRLFSWKDQLYLCFFEAGTNPSQFEPRKVHFRKRDYFGNWEAGRYPELDGWVPWRIKERNGRLIMSAYSGFGLYDKSVGGELRLFSSGNGENWAPLDSLPQIQHPTSVSEGAFEFDDEGNLWGNARLELSGSYLFFAEKGNLGEWELFFSPHKYDSPLMFKEKGEIYLISRRNLDGTFTKKEKRPMLNLIRYSFTRKKTSLFKLDQKGKKWIHIVDFPSTGDTAFPAISKTKDGNYLLMNYSSDINKKEKNWIRGQLGKTYIYKSYLKFD